MQSSSSGSRSRNNVFGKLFQGKLKKSPQAGGTSSPTPTSPTPSPSRPVSTDISHLVGDFEALAGKAEARQAASGVGYPQMKAFLQSAGNLTEGGAGTPGLLAALHVGLRVVQTAEMARDNKQMCFNVAQHAYQLLKIVNDMSLPNDPHLQDISGSLTQKLQSVHIALKDMSSRHWLGNLAHANEDRNAINECEKFINWSVSMLQLELQYIQIKKTDEIAKRQVEGVKKAHPMRRMTDTSFEFSTQTPPLPVAFCGRTSLVEQARRIILDVSGANLAITGTGGMGKTTLSLALLHDKDIKMHFGDHLHFLSCEAIKSATQIVNGLILALGHEEELNAVAGGTHKLHRDSRRLLHNILNTSGPLMVVLDNFETPWNESSSQQHIHDVLKDIAALDNVTVVITTRVTVLPGGINWSPFLPEDILPPLDLDSARSVFIQESRLKLKEEESKDLDELLREVDCIPLAVTLLSKASRSKSPTILLRRWKEEQTSMLRALGHSKKTKLNSVEVSIEVSVAPYKETDEIKMVTLLSFLPAGIYDWESEIYEMEIKLEKPHQLVDNLLTASLLQVTAGFLHMLSPVQYYIRKQYGDSCLNELKDLSEHYMQLIEENLKDPDEEHDPILFSQANNIAAILKEAMGKFPSQAVFNTAYLYSQYLEKSRKGIIDLANTIIDGIKYKKCEINEAEVLMHLAILYKTERIYSKAKAAYEGVYQKLKPTIAEYDGESKAVVPLSDDEQSRVSKTRLEMATCLEGIANVLYLEENLLAADEKYEAAYVQYNAIGNQLGMADCSWCMGSLLHSLNMYPQAVEKMEEVYKQYDAIGDKMGMANCIAKTGEILLDEGNYAAAIEKLEAGWRYYRKVDFKIGLANCLLSIARCLHFQGNYTAAMETVTSAHELYVDIREKSGMPSCLWTMGIILCSEKKYSAAMEKLQAAYDQFKAIGFKLGMARSLKSLGETLHAQGDHEAAKKKVQSAIDTFAAIKNEKELTECIPLLESITHAMNG
ncbi:hypothetical protein AX17_001977 [Amanita inopinata Kibby_2008]|nr:hypothetical protein AX17_001977 [Amanita inopinata Kibby_2008]